MKYTDTVILVFAKAPIAGKVNTRLIDSLGIDKATQLQHDFVHHRLSSLSQSELCKVVLYCAPDYSNDFFKHCAKQYSVTLKNQIGIDLGERMANAIDEQAIEYKRIIVIGTDAPALNCEHIENAINALNDAADVVIVPAEDGGYVLIGTNGSYRTLFLSVPWGTERVMVKTRANAIASGLKLKELDTCWDIDRPEDYARWLRISDGV